MIPGTQGYAEQAAELILRYESVPFEHKYRAERHLLPAVPSRILDVGAGTGADAAWLAARSHTVLAVEPTAALRVAGQARHPHPTIEWLDDSLPELARVRHRRQQFDVLMLTAVWMHLDLAERARAMPTLAALLAPRGLLLLSLRHGPVPAQRRMFEVSGAETVALAQSHGLECVLQMAAESSQAVNRAAGVHWTRLAFRWPGVAPQAPPKNLILKT